MFTQYLTDEQLDKLDPEKVCVVESVGGSDLYAETAADLLEESPGLTISQALDERLNHCGRNSFEILMTNSAGQIVKVEKSSA